MSVVSLFTVNVNNLHVHRPAALSGKWYNFANEEGQSIS